MAVAMTLQRYLDDQHIEYDVITHKKTAQSTMSAQSSKVSGDNLAKGVVLKSGGTYVLAVLPATQHVELKKLKALFGDNIRLATENEASQMFPDCELGAVPALGLAYGLPAVVDEQLESRSDIYFEGGDHRSLVHISGDQFGRLMGDVPHGRFSY